MKKKKVWERRAVGLRTIVCLAVMLWGVLGDSEMTGQQVRLQRWVMLALEVRLGE